MCSDLQLIVKSLVVRTESGLSFDRLREIRLKERYSMAIKNPPVFRSSMEYRVIGRISPIVERYSLVPHDTPHSGRCRLSPMGALTYAKLHTPVPGHRERSSQLRAAFRLCFPTS